MHQVPLTFQGDKIDWHGFDRYDFVMDKQGVNAIPRKLLNNSEGKLWQGCELLLIRLFSSTSSLKEVRQKHSSLPPPVWLS